MEPVSAGIMGAAGLVGSLLGARAQAAQNRTNIKLQGVQSQADATRSAAQSLSQGQQKAFEDILAAFRGATT